MNFVKKNLIFFIVCSLTLLASLYLIYMDLATHSLISKANTDTETSRQKADKAYKGKGNRPVDPNVKMIASDTEVVKHRTAMLQRIFGKPYRMALIAFAKEIGMTEDDLLNKFRDFFESEEQTDKSVEVLIPAFKKTLGDEKKVETAFNHFIEAVQKITVEPLQGQAANDIFAVALGVPRSMNSSSCHVLLATMQRNIFDRRNIPGVLNIQTVRDFTYNEYVQTPPPLNKISDILTMMPIYEDIFSRMRQSKVANVESFSRLNEGVAHSDKYMKYSFKTQITGELDAIRKFVNALHEAYKENQVYVVTWVSLTSHTDQEIAQARLLITGNANAPAAAPVRQPNIRNNMPEMMPPNFPRPYFQQPNIPRIFPRPNFQQPNRANVVSANESHLPPEERSDYGKAIIGVNRYVTAEMEFDYYVFIGDRLVKTN